MARLTKIAVIEQLKALGVEASEDTPYGELVAQLKALQPDVSDESATDENSSESEERLTPPEPEAPEAPEQVESRLEVPVEPEEAPVEDYLQKYQFKNAETPIGSIKTNPAVGSKPWIMKMHLLKQRKVAVMIPRRQGESVMITLAVNLNGYHLEIPKQTYVELPEQVAQLIMDSQGQTDAALQYKRIDGNSAKEAALL